MRASMQLFFMVVMAVSVVGCSDGVEPAQGALLERDAIDVGDPCFTDEDCGVCERCHFTQICRKIVDGCQDSHVCEDGVIVDTCETPQQCCEKPAGVGCYNYCEYCEGDVLYLGNREEFTDCCKVFGETCDEYEWSLGCGGVCTTKQPDAQYGGAALACEPPPQPE